MPNRLYAVFKLSGFQFGAEEGEVLRVPRQQASEGDTIDISEVLMLKDNDDTRIGTPLVDSAKVEAEVLSHGKADKVVVYKYKRRTKYRRTRGHRQDYSEIRIKRIAAS